jgi:transposase
LLDARRLTFSARADVSESYSKDITARLRPLLRLCRENLERLQKTESALVRSLGRDLLLLQRVERLKTIPAVGPITALTWALEIGDVKRFPSYKQVISYCGLCGDEKQFMPLAPELGWDYTKFWRRSAQAAWERCIAPRTSSLAAKFRLK